MSSTSKRSISIDVWCFVFSLIIVLNHLKQLRPIIGSPLYFQNGYFPVGFFFITSGYLMVTNAMKCGTSTTSFGKLTWQFLYKKFKSIAFFFLTGWLAVLAIALKNDQFKTVADFFLVIFEALMLQSTGVSGTFMNAPAWYLSAMFIAMLISYPLCLKYRENFYLLIAPILSIFLIGVISHTTGGLQGGNWYGFPLLGDDFVRGLLGVSLGAVSYAIGTHFITHCQTAKSRILLTVLEVAGYIASLLIFSTKWGTSLDFVCWMTFALCVAISFSHKSYISYFFAVFAPIAPFLRKLSTAIFLNHWWIVKVAVLLCQK